MIVSVILAGGSGNKLWPLLQGSQPKQFLPLTTQKTMLQETILHAKKISPHTVIICNSESQHLVKAQLNELNIDDVKIILEPVEKNTASAITVAALLYQEKNAKLLILPADHYLNENLFGLAVNNAISSAEEDKLVLFGVFPTYPQPEYGYIKYSNKINNTPAYDVAHFVEKPSVAQAKDYVSSGAYYWNSGIFLFKASQYLNELETYAPDIKAVCLRTLECTKTDEAIINLDKVSYSECRSISVDYAIMEKTQNAVMIPLSADWIDVGTWKKLYDIQPTAENDSKQSRLKENIVHKPWGLYEVLQKTDSFQVKRIFVKPSECLSLQMHFHRSEHWIVVNGTAKVHLNDEVTYLSENESIYIPKTAKHRISNPGKKDLEIIEIQCGTYLGEDDILRFEDSYGREDTQENRELTYF